MNSVKRPDFDLDCECGYWLCRECGYPVYPMEYDDQGGCPECGGCMVFSPRGRRPFFSERGLELHCWTLGDRPVVTAEIADKWYGLHVIHPSGRVDRLDDYVDAARYSRLEDEFFRAGGPAGTAHTDHPGFVRRVADDLGMEVDPGALEVITGRWIVESGTELPGLYKGRRTVKKTILDGPPKRNLVVEDGGLRHVDGRCVREYLRDWQRDADIPEGAEVCVITRATLAELISGYGLNMCA